MASYLVTLTVLSVCLATVLATSYIPLCPDSEGYLPCECTDEYGGKYLDLFCNTTDGVKNALEVAQNRSKVISRLNVEINGVTELPDNLFEGVYIRELHLYVPQLEVLSPQVFSGQEGNIEDLTISTSNLSAIPVEALSVLNNLTVITVSYSPNIDTITNETFSDLRNIKNIYTIDLRNNKISEIEDGAFTKFTRLERLILSDNLITELSVDALPEQKLLTLSLNGLPFESFPLELVTKLQSADGWLSVERMNITTLSEELLDAVGTAGINTSVRDNPLNCDCAFKKLAADPHYYDVKGRCVEPPQLASRRLFSLKPEDFAHCA